MKSILALCLIVLVAKSLGMQLPAKNVPENPAQLSEGMDPDLLPLNTVVLEGSTVALRCAAMPPGTQYSIQWVEYTTSIFGSPISDNEFISPSHPRNARYRIIHDSPFQYFLEITNVTLADGGVYQCRDGQAGQGTKATHQCSLTVLAAEMNCNTTIRDSGVVLDLSTITNECIIEYQGYLIPNMTWSGIGPFNQLEVATTTNVWVGMNYNVTRAADTRAHQCTIFFTSYFHPVDGNSADNVPTYTRIFQSRQMYVFWGPVSHTVTPQKSEYEPGDVLTCNADAFPFATYLWQNMITNEIFVGTTITVMDNWRGQVVVVRCEARNTIEGQVYSSNVFQNCSVPALTTPTTTTPTTTTTPPPAVAECTDLTGAWISTNPTAASLCVRLDLSNNGLMTGLLKNSTDTYWVDILGRAQADKFDQVGFNGIWPLNIGVSSFVGECHRCFGIETLLVNVVSKAKGTLCGVPGVTQYTTQYLFERDFRGLIRCPNIPTW